MEYRTLQEVRRKIELEHDLTEESFISPTEMDNYIREGIDIAEGRIINLFEDYYLNTTEWLPIVDEADMPSDIYANKLRKVEVLDTSNIASQILHDKHLKDDNVVRYRIYNKSGGKPTLVIDKDDDLKFYKLHYIRNANRPTEDNDLIDLPECAIHFVTSFVKARAYEKEMDPRTKTAKSEMNSYMALMEETLSNMVDDTSGYLDPDLSHYEEFDCELML